MISFTMISHFQLVFWVLVAVASLLLDIEVHTVLLSSLNFGLVTAVAPSIQSISSGVAFHFVTALLLAYILASFFVATERSAMDQQQEIVVHTGNILNFEHLKKRVNLGPQEELVDCLRDALQKSASELQRAGADATELQCGDRNPQLFTDEDREDMKITVKLFLMDGSASSVASAVQHTLQHLQISRIDLLLVSFPSHNFTNFEGAWRSMEKLVDTGAAESIGVSDFSLDELQALFEAAKVKPSVNQVNLESCCVIPPELSEYAKKNQIQLLTHNDPRTMLEPDAVSEVLKSSVASLVPTEWQAVWLIRYVAMVKLRGVVKSRGFVFAIRHRNA